MVTITIKADEVQKLLGQAVAAAKDCSPVFRVVATRLKQDIARNFMTGGAYWPGPAWKPARRGGRTLVDTATLRNSMHTASGARWAAVGTDVKYAAIHQFGGVIKAKNSITIYPKKPDGRLAFKVGGQTVFAKKVTQTLLRWKIGDKWVAKPQVTIPARPFLPVDSAGNLSPSTTQFIIEKFTKHILGT
ncbi:MAG: hypothetical protein A2Y38_14435 [Spirochaetes bacterium GWB1_59_5]|nr:MAG: hypothetical protein A2Y38_14435 [Spirochaetes bacterium GWB1_59_5]